MHASRADLARIRAALDAAPFADPVRVGPHEMRRAEARRLERELTAKFSARPVGSQAGDVAQQRASHPSPAVASRATTLPESVSAPNREVLSGLSDLRFHEAI